MFGGGGSKLMNLKVACVLILERVLFSNNFSEGHGVTLHVKNRGVFFVKVGYHNIFVVFSYIAVLNTK